MTQSANTRSTPPPNPASPDQARPIDRLLTIMARLRDPNGGCPWDVEQDFRSIAPYTIEEAYEVADAIEQNDMPGLQDELGDLLLQVVFHARMAEEAGHFAFDDVAGGISDKMVRRHPHVFGDQSVDGAEAQTQAWEDTKAAERAAKAENSDQPVSALDGVAAGLPALLRALKLQKRAARVRFDWPDTAQVFAKIEEEIGEIKHEMDNGGEPARLEDEVGDLLFVVVNLARHLQVDPESALRSTNAKFERRFKMMERYFASRGEDMAALDLAVMEDAWVAAKRQEG